jgi:hypothetical protein
MEKIKGFIKGNSKKLWGNVNLCQKIMMKIYIHI